MGEYVVEQKRKSYTVVFAIPSILILIICFVAFMLQNNSYNHTEHIGKLDESHMKGAVYDFEDITVDLTVRGGDSGAWLKDPIYDNDGNMLHGASVGTIYEVVVSNKSKNVVSDWKIKIPINEMMWVNNNWDSKMEIHQNVAGDEKVLAIDLSDYSEYDINLDYYIDHTGPMIPLYEGDYFIYLPEEITNEKPIQPNKTGAIGEGTSRFGFIMYIPDQTVDYVSDFSGGEITYYMYSNPVKQNWFWILIILMFIWLVGIIIQMVVKFKMRKLLEQQRKQKLHDAEMVKQTMQLLTNFIESKDPNTKGHSLRVAELSKMIALKMGLSEDEAQSVYYIGLLHDCGKIYIPDEILKNPGRLSDKEYEVMKKHTVYGSDVLKNFSSIPDIDIGAKYHHERYDGKGYPSGKVGEDIPFIARIIGVADAIDAMNSNRCYRDSLPADVIMKELTENRGKQFDPTVLDAALSLIEAGDIELSANA